MANRERGRTGSICTACRLSILFERLRSDRHCRKEWSVFPGKSQISNWRVSWRGITRPWSFFRALWWTLWTWSVSRYPRTYDLKQLSHEKTSASQNHPNIQSLFLSLFSLSPLRGRSCFLFPCSSFFLGFLRGYLLDHVRLRCVDRSTYIL